MDEAKDKLLKKAEPLSDVSQVVGESSQAEKAGENLLVAAYLEDGASSKLGRKSGANAEAELPVFERARAVSSEQNLKRALPVPEPGTESQLKAAYRNIQAPDKIAPDKTVSQRDSEGFASGSTKKPAYRDNSYTVNAYPANSKYPVNSMNPADAYPANSKYSLAEKDMGRAAVKEALMNSPMLYSSPKLMQEKMEQISQQSVERAFQKEYARDAYASRGEFSPAKESASAPRQNESLLDQLKNFDGSKTGACSIEEAKANGTYMSSQTKTDSAYFSRQIDTKEASVKEFPSRDTYRSAEISSALSKAEFYKSIETAKSEFREYGSPGKSSELRYDPTASSGKDLNTRFSNDLDIKFNGAFDPKEKYQAASEASDRARTQERADFDSSSSGQKTSFDLLKSGSESYKSGGDLSKFGAESFKSGSESFKSGGESFKSGGESFKSGGDLSKSGESFKSGASDSGRDLLQKYSDPRAENSKAFTELKSDTRTFEALNESRRVFELKAINEKPAQEKTSKSHTDELERPSYVQAAQTAQAAEKAALPEIMRVANSFSFARSQVQLPESESTGLSIKLIAQQDKAVLPNSVSVSFLPLQQDRVSGSLFQANQQSDRTIQQQISPIGDRQSPVPGNLQTGLLAADAQGRLTQRADEAALNAGRKDGGSILPPAVLDQRLQSLDGATAAQKGLLILESNQSGVRIAGIDAQVGLQGLKINGDPQGKTNSISEKIDAGIFDQAGKHGLQIKQNLNLQNDGTLHAAKTLSGLAGAENASGKNIAFANLEGRVELDENGLPLKRVRAVSSEKRYLTGVELTIAAVIAMSGAAKVREVQLLAHDPDSNRNSGENEQGAQILRRRMHLVSAGETLQSIAENFYQNQAVAWLIADINARNIKEEWLEGKRIVELRARQQIELPEAEEVQDFLTHLRRDFNVDQLLTLVSENHIDRELLDNFLGTVSGASQPAPAKNGAAAQEEIPLPLPELSIDLDNPEDLPVSQGIASIARDMSSKFRNIIKRPARKLGAVGS